MRTKINSLSTVVPSKYRVSLEIKRNGKQPTAAEAASWTRFNFVVEKQMLIAYDDSMVGSRRDDDDGDHQTTPPPKGMIDLVGCRAFKCDSSSFASQGKLFVFKLISIGFSSSSSFSSRKAPSSSSSSSSSSSCQYLFSAPSELLRERTVVILNFAAIDPYWFDPFCDLTPTGVDQRMPSSMTSIVHTPAAIQVVAAAKIIISLFRIRVALSRRHALQSRLPSIYILQINEVTTSVGGGGTLSGSVRGLIAKKDRITSICIANIIIPTFPSSSSSSMDSKGRQPPPAIALVTCDSAMTFLSLDVIKAKKQPLGRVRTYVLCTHSCTNQQWYRSIDSISILVSCC